VIRGGVHARASACRRSLPIKTPVDAIVAGGVARRFAGDLGAGPRFAASFAIVAAELASNIAHHASGGVLHLELLGSTFVIEAVDDGPRPDGSDRPFRRGLGIGHGAVERLSHRVSVRALEGGGRSVRAEIELREGAP
jgi:anti-sigma regulatory factor (Ser/Thr protein kinase)